MASFHSKPLVEPPHSDASRRFIETGAPCESAEEYRPGGFHPVNLGDTFSDKKYRIIRKLGDGSYSTVWLAVSTGTPRYVALKVMVAKASTSNTELDILGHLSKNSQKQGVFQENHQIKNNHHVTALLDTFQHHGPNGLHRCLAFEPMGTTAASLVEELPQNKPKKRGKPQRYPKRMAKKILLHVIKGLAWIHQNEVVHGDVQPGNILFSIGDLAPVHEEELKQDEASTAIPLCRVDGRIDCWAPKNLYLKQPLYDRVRLGPDLQVKISDLGSAFWESNPPKSTVIPLSLRAPELILHRQFDRGIDLWSFGCLVFEIIAGKALFVVMQFGHDQKDEEEADDEHLLQLNDIIGPLPDSIIDSWPRYSTWYGPGRRRRNPFGDEEPYIYKSLENHFAECKSDEFDDKESAVICALIRDILVYDPSKRPSAIDILKHPWFVE
ncbi:serine protein kinase [Dendryphion nanum]|uniref:non-specific serine/threonine protein kinase n=1 Tax=Dendryphion nanum TaxID=256645 RepID=A0A9P9D1F3_9PLEO|nr:serine protein kinase [Dendryphion nanum]